MFSDDHWGVTDAQVVCRTLGFSTDGAAATWNSQFGDVSTTFIMDDVHCTGTESHIGLCNHNPIDNCGASEGAGVICPYDTNANRVTLVGGNTANEGNVMLNGRPIWYVYLNYLIATARQFTVISACNSVQLLIKAHKH